MTTVFLSPGAYAGAGGLAAKDPVPRSCQASLSLLWAGWKVRYHGLKLVWFVLNMVPPVIVLLKQKKFSCCCQVTSKHVTN